jgi:hypothetical protein
MPTPFGEINLDGVNYKNGFGGLLTQNPGKYRLATLTITGVTGTPSIQFVDQIAGSNDFTAFGTRCDGNGFDSTYKLDGPVTQSIQGAGDWFDADGLPSGGGPVNTAPVLAAIGNKTIAEGSLLSFTATATIRMRVRRSRSRSARVLRRARRSRRAARSRGLPRKRRGRTSTPSRSTSRTAPTRTRRRSTSRSAR